LPTERLDGCQYLIAGATMSGGISYFHTYAYDLLATNERIMAATCDAAIAAHRDGGLEKVTYLSSSMVYESADRWPSREGDERRIPPPASSYGFQKLAVEYRSEERRVGKEWRYRRARTSQAKNDSTGVHHSEMHKTTSAYYK